MCKHDLSKSSCLKQCTQTKYPQANMHLRIKLSKNGPLSKLPNSLSKSIQVSSICTLRLLLHACAFLYIMYSIYSCIHVNAQWDQGQGKERCQPTLEEQNQLTGGQAAWPIFCSFDLLMSSSLSASVFHHLGLHQSVPPTSVLSAQKKISNAKNLYARLARTCQS